MTKTRIIRPVKKPPSLHISVQESVKAYIEDNRLNAGDALPPEGVLARQLGVSRNSMREALRALESVGILETRRGVGVFVKQFSFDSLFDHLAYGLHGTLDELSELYEMRWVLECALIEKTVRVIGDEDLAALRAVTERMRVRAERNENFKEEDQEFHQLLFRCHHSKMILKLLDVFWMAFYKASEWIDLYSWTPLQTWQDHHDIVEAIAARDVDAARERLDNHYRGLLAILADKNDQTKRRVS